MKAVLNRLDHGSKQTLGHFILYDGLEVVFECKSLELPDRDNQKDISRIPSGKYTLQRRYSKAHKLHFIFNHVEGRSFVLIHAGNYYTQIRGCVLIGSSFKDINNDGFRDVQNSRKTLNRLLVKTSRFELTINDL